MGAGGEERQGPRDVAGVGGVVGPAFPQAQAQGRLFRFQASCVQYRLVVRDVNSLQILRLYTCLDQIQHIEWSADSLFILCAMYKRGLVQVGARAAPVCGAGSRDASRVGTGVLCPSGLEQRRCSGSRLPLAL